MSTSVIKKTETDQERLDRLQGEIDSLRDQLQDAHRLATLGTMTAMVAHEFNNILTPIINYAQLAQTNPKLVDKAIKRAADGGQRASEICGAILGLTRDEPPETVDVDIQELVKVTIDAMGRTPAQDGIELTLAIPDGLVVKTHRVMLQQVILNLLINARYALLGKRRPRKLTLSASVAGGTVSINVTDNGEGIPPENIEKIFDPFFSTKTQGNSESEGFGLGLATCRRIVTSLDGEINATSQPGAGCTFSVTLPC